MDYEAQHFFNIGEWVQMVDKDNFLNGRKGYIEEHDFWNSRYRVKFTSNANGECSQGRGWIPEKYLISVNDERHEDDLSTLIDLALKTKDEEWFQELTSKMPLQNG